MIKRSRLISTPFFNIYSMEHIKLFEDYKTEAVVIEIICQRYNIKNYTINPDLSIDVDGSVSLYYKNLTKLPLQFNNVNGSFDCGNNELLSLKGCPRYVGGDFSCTRNLLTSLKYAPSEVGGRIYIDNLQLPKEVLDFKDKTILLRHQEEYGIWNDDGSFNQGRWKIFEKDYRAGLLAQKLK